MQKIIHKSHIFSYFSWPYNCIFEGLFIIIYCIHKLYFSAEEVPGGEPTAQAVVYFTHSGTILKLLAHLGLYKDENVLLHTNFNTMGSYRKWRVSQIDSFGSNLAFVLFRCVCFLCYILKNQSVISCISFILHATNEWLKERFYPKQNVNWLAYDGDSTSI